MSLKCNGIRTRVLTDLPPCGGRRGHGTRPAMKLATLRNGTRDGALALVSADLLPVR